jgi:hypothetical protein
MIDDDEVISTSAHLHERNSHGASGLKQIQISNGKCQMNDNAQMSN